MEPFGHLDFIVYFLALYYYILTEHGLYALLQFWFTNFPRNIIYNYINNRVFLPFPYQSFFLQKSSNVEYVFTQLLKHYLSKLSSKPYSSLFFDGRIFKNINRIRRWRYFSDGLGDITINDISKGLWIYSDSRIDLGKHDIGIFYIQGNLGSSSTSGYLYSEYLSLLALNLLQQGFKNPGIFIPLNDYNLTKLLECYNHFQSHFTNIVIMADSLGAKLAFSLLLHISTNELIKPNLVILISPIIHLMGDDNDDDYINSSVINKWNKRFDQGVNIVDSLTSKELEQVLPNLLITYGSEEYLAAAIEKFIDRIKQKTNINIRVDCYKGRIHNWPIMGFYTERFVDKREFSIHFYASFIARTLLGKKFFNSSVTPTNVNLRDEDFV